MDVTALPFGQLIGLERTPPDGDFLMALPDGPQYHNHLGTVHAGALLTLAESASGEFLLRRFGLPPGLVPVVRRLEARFRRPARGRVAARASAEAADLARLTADLAAKGRALVRVAVEVVDEGQAVALSAVVEWFVSRGPESG